MDYESLSREELIARLSALHEYMDNVIVFWGDKREFRDMFKAVAANEDGEYSAEEVKSARLILADDSAFEEFIELIRDSFDRGGINYAISEKISVIMQEVAEKHQ